MLSPSLTLSRVARSAFSRRTLFKVLSQTSKEKRISTPLSMRVPIFREKRAERFFNLKGPKTGRRNRNPSQAQRPPSVLRNSRNITPARMIMPRISHPWCLTTELADISILVGRGKGAFILAKIAAKRGITTTRLKITTPRARTERTTG